MTEGETRYYQMVAYCPVCGLEQPARNFRCSEGCSSNMPLRIMGYSQVTEEQWIKSIRSRSPGSGTQCTGDTNQ